MSIDSKAMVIKSLFEELYEFDITVDKTTKVRDTIINKLAKSVSSIEDISTTDPDASIAQLGVINTTLRALSDQEAAMTRRVTTKIRHQENQRADNTSEQVVKLIQTISNARSNGQDSVYPPIDVNTICLNLEQELLKVGDELLDTELRVDPDDLT